MRKQIGWLVGAGFLALLIAACSSDNKAKAEGATSDWLKLVDAGNYAQSWDESAHLMKSTIDKERWQQILQDNRAPLGAVLSRKLKSAEYTADLPGAPSGQYVILQYESRFEHNSSVIETATPMLDKDGKWRVSLYFVK